MTQQSKAAQVRDGVVGLAVLLVCGWLLVKCVSGDSDETKAKAAAEAAACKKDLQCWGDKGTVAAGIYCPKHVEGLAKHSVKWTDGTLEPKFSRFRWQKKDEASITFIGDKAQFQNGFGAFTPVIYECDLDGEQSRVLDVRVREGRLPISN